VKSVRYAAMLAGVIYAAYLSLVTSAESAQFLLVIGMINYLAALFQINLQ
jgi:hypothetical protein